MQRGEASKIVENLLTNRNVGDIITKLSTRDGEINEIEVQAVAITSPEKNLKKISKTS